MRRESFQPAPLPKTLHPRRDFLKLAGMNEGALNAAVQRDQMPFLPGSLDHPDFLMCDVRPPGPSEDQPGWDARGWATDVALAYIIQRDFVERHQVRVERANEIARYVLHVGRIWPTVRELAERQIENKAPFEPDIMLASILRRDLKRGIGFGTLTEIAKLEPTAISIIGVSLVAAAVLLRQRADEHNIDISSFWDIGK